MPHQDRLTTLGFETVTATPDELVAFLKSDFTKWANVIRAAGIKASQLPTLRDSSTRARE